MYEGLLDPAEGRGRKGVFGEEGGGYGDSRYGGTQRPAVLSRTRAV